MVQCNKCRREITFREVNEKWMPYDLDGRTLHFNTCPENDPRNNMVKCLPCDGWFNDWDNYKEHVDIYGHRGYQRWLMK